MPSYHSHNPRHSTGSLALYNPHHEHHSPSGSTCEACAYENSSMPLNTPWSSPPTSSTSSHPRRGRTSISSDKQRPTLHHQRPITPPSHPLIIQQAPEVRASSSSRHERHQREREREHDRSSLLVPASSGSHRRTKSKSSAYTRNSSRRYDDFASSLSGLTISPAAASETSDDRRGRTRFPRKLVSRDAAEERGYPFSIESDGAITVLQALSQTEIDKLVDLTEEIRHRGVQRKAVSFSPETLVQEFPCKVMAVTNGSSARDRTYLLPLGPPGPGTPKTELQGMMLTVTAGEERFAKAVQRAERKERRAKETGRKSDVEDAWDARRKAEDLGRKVGVGKGGVVSVSG